MSTSEESLSALVDDELQNIPSVLLEETAQRDTWSRYHLIGEVLRQGDARAAVARLETRVARALAAEPVVLAPRDSRAPSRSSITAPGEALVSPWRGRRVALAAGLIGLAVGAVTWGTLSRQTEVAPALVVASEPPALEGTQAVEWNAAGEPGSPEAGDLRRRMNNYLMRFSEQRAGLAVPNVHPYVRIVGFEQEAGR